MRSRSDRVVGGVCAGVADYFGVDAFYIRIAAVASVFLAGLGGLLYLGALLLLPEEDGPPLANTTTGRGRLLAAIGVVALVAAAGVILSGAVLGAVWGLLPLAILALLGLGVWWLASGEGVSGDWRVLLKRSLLGLALLVGSAIVFVAGAVAAGTGQGEIAAGLVIGAGLAVVVGAFVRPVRFLVPPALALAIGAGFVAAADVDLKGGVGERKYRPAAAADVRDQYRLGMGHLVIDLRDTELPRGDVPLRLKLGMGEAELVVPKNVCVATRAEIGAGVARVFDRENDGVDVDYEDLPGAAPTVTRIVVDADIGFGAFEVSHEESDHRFGTPGPGNQSCARREEARAQT